MRAVILPVRDQGQLTEAICAHLREHEDYDRLLICDNGSGQEALQVAINAVDADQGRTQLRFAPGRSLYQMWNGAWDDLLLEAAGEDLDLAILNNDISIAPGTLDVLAKVLRDTRYAAGIAYPDPDAPVGDAAAATGVVHTRGSYRHGGMTGWCFMVRGELRLLGLPPVDEDLVWWCGDDDLAFAVEEVGFTQARVLGLGCDHVGEATARHHPELQEQKGRDLATLEAKWEPR